MRALTDLHVRERDNMSVPKGLRKQTITARTSLSSTFISTRTDKSRDPRQKAHKTIFFLEWQCGFVFVRKGFSMLLLFCWLHVALAGVVLSRTALSVNSTTSCFVTICNGTFSVVPILNVTVGGILLTLGEVQPVLGLAGLSGELWLSWPICSVFRLPNGQLYAYRPGWFVK